MLKEILNAVLKRNSFVLNVLKGIHALKLIRKFYKTIGFLEIIWK